MTATSPYYFDAAARGSQFYQDIPTFAIHAGPSVGRGWASAEADSPGRFAAIMEIINPQVPVHLAMPRYYANQFFKPNTQYSSVSLSAFKPLRANGFESGSGYMTGNPVTMVLENVMVKSIVPILQWNGLPIPPQVQKNYLEKKIGREAYAPVAITLFVEWGRIA